MERIDLHNIRNIIFDLGVVLLDLDFDHANRKFQNLGLQDLKALYSFMHANPFFHDFETGKMKNRSFIKGIKKLLPKTVSDAEILDAWNTIVVGFPDDKIQFIKQICEKYNIYLLSNTNPIHAIKYEQQFLQAAGKPMEDYFDKIYYSHTLKIRKPDKKAYQKVLKENNLEANETLFIDDQIDNLLPAEKLSIKTFLYKKEWNLFDLFGIRNNILL